MLRVLEAAEESMKTRQVVRLGGVVDAAHLPGHEVLEIEQEDADEDED